MTSLFFCYQLVTSITSLSIPTLVSVPFKMVMSHLGFHTVVAHDGFLPSVLSQCDIFNITSAHVNRPISNLPLTL